MKIYIISWFGEGKNLRQTRKHAHRKQLEWARKHSLEIHVLNMEYEDNDYEADVTYHGDNKKRRPGDARNKLLEIFYANNDDYAIISDNDASFRDISDFDFLTEFKKNQERFVERNVGMITPLNPVFLPFNKEYQSNKEHYDTNFALQKNTHTKGSLFICLNFKKHLGSPIYFDERYNREDIFIPKEDVEFGIQCMMSGYFVGYSRNVVLVEFASSKSTWAKGKRALQEGEGDRIMVEKHNIPFDDLNKNIYYGLELNKDELKPTNKENANIKFDRGMKKKEILDWLKTSEYKNYGFTYKDYDVKMNISRLKDVANQPTRLYFPVDSTDTLEGFFG